jgi:hypothetical protein
MAFLQVFVSGPAPLFLFRSIVLCNDKFFSDNWYLIKMGGC